MTITDYATRTLLAREGQTSIKAVFAFQVFEQTFKEYGVPFSRLSVWWLRPGIEIERIKPGNPQQNGRHERMHLILKKETTKTASYNFLQQRALFDTFQEEYNNGRPHEALGM